MLTLIDTDGAHAIQAPVTVTEGSECLDEIARQPHQDRGKAEKLIKTPQRANSTTADININLH